MSHSVLCHFSRLLSSAAFPTELRHTVQVFWGTSQMLLLLSMEDPVPKLPSKIIILNTIIIPTKMVMNHDRARIENRPKDQFQGSA